MRAPTSGLLRWLVSLVVIAVVAGAGVVAYQHGGSDDDQVQQTSGPGASDGPGSGKSRSSVRDPDPDLSAKKARDGIRGCAPGPGGGSLPAVTLSCLGGGTPVDLASLRGPMVLSVWASWCGPCAKEMPALQAFNEDHGSQVPVLGIDFLDQYPGSALDTMRSRGVTYPSLTDPQGELQKQSAFAGLTHLPVLLFIDARGRIAYEHLGGATSEAEVTDLVRQHLGVDL